MLSTFTTEITEYSIRDDGIVLARDINLGTPRTRQNVAASLDSLAEVTGGQLHPGLWDARSVPEFPPSVWQEFVDRIDKVLIALAILVDSDVERTLGPFPTVMNSMLIPVRLFRTADEALDWLRQFVDQPGTPHS